MEITFSGKIESQETEIFLDIPDFNGLQLPIQTATSAFLFVLWNKFQEITWKGSAPLIVRYFNLAKADGTSSKAIIKPSCSGFTVN